MKRSAAAIAIVLVVLGGCSQGKKAPDASPSPTATGKPNPWDSGAPVAPTEAIAPTPAASATAKVNPWSNQPPAAPTEAVIPKVAASATPAVNPWSNKPAPLPSGATK